MNSDDRPLGPSGWGRFLRRLWPTLVLAGTFALGRAHGGQSESTAHKQAKPVLGKFMPSSAVFIENRGQWEDGAVRFALSGHGVNVGLTSEGIRSSCSAARRRGTARSRKPRLTQEMAPPRTRQARDPDAIFGTGAGENASGRGSPRRFG